MINKKLDRIEVEFFCRDRLMLKKCRYWNGVGV